jgi:hypothetical protein
MRTLSDLFNTQQRFPEQAWRLSNNQWFSEHTARLPSLSIIMKRIFLPPEFMSTFAASYTGCPRRKGQYSRKSYYRSVYARKVCMCPIPNGFRDRAVSLYSSSSNTPCPLTRCKVHWCWLEFSKRCYIMWPCDGMIPAQGSYRLS